MAGTTALEKSRESSADRLCIFTDYNALGRLPWWLSVKNPPANTEDVGSIPRSGGSPGEGNGNPLQYSCLENPMDRGGWQATVHGVAKESDRTERLNNNGKAMQCAVHSLVLSEESEHTSAFRTSHLCKISSFVRD